MNKSVLGAGLVAVDHVFKSRKKRTSAGYTYLGSTGGGSVSNTLCMLSLLGYRTHIFGLVGNDYPQRIVATNFAKFGVDHSLLISRGGPKDFRQTRQFSHVVYPNGKHSFREKCLQCNQPFVRDFQMVKEDLSEKVRDLAGRANVVHIDRANGATKELVAIAKKRGNTISFDVAFESYGAYRKTTSEILELSTLVKITEPVFEKHIGAKKTNGVRKWWKKYPETQYLLVTRGENGVYGFAALGSERTTFDYGGISCEHFRDSAGAGDILTAIAIHNLLLRRPPSNKSALDKRLGQAQAIASLSCSLYGARSLQFVFLDQGVLPKKITNWANHILKAGKSGNSFLPLIGLRGRDRFSNPSRLAPFRICSVCGMPFSKKSTFRKKTETRVKPVSFEFVPYCMMNGFFVGKSYRSRLTRLTRSPTLLIGSGGSLSASIFGEQLILRTLGRTAKAIPPFEFEGLKNLQKDTVVWLLSYGGSNPDIMGAAKRTANLEVKNCIVLTGARNSKLARFARDNSWHLVYLKAEERGFVSTIGMLAMISALVGILIPDERVDEMAHFFDEVNLLNLAKNADRTSKEIATNFSDRIDSTHIIALGSGWGWPALIDFESKIVEGGICTIEISEIKNFTHGRYINALYHRSNRHFILFSSPLETELVAFFDKKLRRHFPQRLDVLRTELPDMKGALDLVIQAILLAFRLGEKASRNLLEPEYPSEARGLYGWEPSYRRTKK